MESATIKVKFSFVKLMYEQMDGIAMGGPLGPVMANIFIIFFSVSNSLRFSTEY